MHFSFTSESFNRNFDNSFLPFFWGAVASIYTSLGHPFTYGKAEFGKDIVEPDRQWMLQFTSGDKGLFYHLLENKLISGNRIKTLSGGLDGVIEGLKLLEEGKVCAFYNRVLIV